MGLKRKVLIIKFLQKETHTFVGFSLTNANPITLYVKILTYTYIAIGAKELFSYRACRESG